MKIEFEFSGGYGGMFAAKPLRYRLDTDEMPQAVRDELLALVRTSGILELEGKVKKATSGPQRDVFTYQLSILEAGKTRSFTFDDVTAPPSVRPLLQFLQKHALEQRK